MQPEEVSKHALHADLCSLAVLHSLSSHNVPALFPLYVWWAVASHHAHLKVWMQ